MRVVSFFSGCGGLDLGFRQAGFQVVWANEFEPAVFETYQKNHPGTTLCKKDIQKIKLKDVPSCDGFIGGPPCQSWSVAGKQKGLDDERGKLFLTYIKMIKHHKPKFFVIENVKGILDDKFKDVFSSFISRLADAGYDVHYKLLDAVHFGTPQNRERVFIVGFLNKLHIDYRFPEAITKTPITLQQAIGDITEKPRYFKDGDSVPESEGRLNHDVIDCYFGDYYHRGNRRRDWNRPSFTIHATASNAPLHPSSPKMRYIGYENWEFEEPRNKYRRLSVRECARIQTFPDYFQFFYSDIKSAYKMIGNAVPPRMAFHLANSIKNALGEQATIMDKIVLVGYYKDSKHLNNILKYGIYNIRSDGRRGSIKESDIMSLPEFLVLHHGSKSFIFRLTKTNPFLMDRDSLIKNGYKVSGVEYLCLSLSSTEELKLRDIVGRDMKLKTLHHYAPYLTTLGEIIQ